MTIDTYRERQSTKTMLKLSTVEGMQSYLSGVCTFSQIHHGKREQGDLVIVNLEFPEWLDLKEYIDHFLPLDRIEITGIYTNIYFKRDFFTRIVKYVTN